MSAPEAIINICSGVRLDNRYEHSIYFADAGAQLEYFAGKVVHTFSAYSYLRKSWDIQVQATMEQARSWSYLYFRNGSGKYYFYFINQIEYINPNSVKLFLELDVVQTYLEEIKAGLLPSFIVRQHTTSDELGEHTVDEGLELGDFVINKTTDLQLYEKLCILVMTTFNPNYAEVENPVPAMSGVYNGVFSGLKVWAIPSSRWVDWGAQLDALSSAGFIDGIITMWMYPQSMVNLYDEESWDDEDTICKIVESCVGVDTFIDMSTEGKVDGYEPKNNKLFSYPFNFLYLSNNSGASATYRYERCDRGFGAFDFRVFGGVTPDAGVKIAPLNYNGAGLNFEEGLFLGDFPSCAWDADMFKLWLAQNRNQHQLTETAGTIGAIAGLGVMTGSIMSGNMMGTVGGLTTAYTSAMQVETLMAQKRDSAIQPNQARGTFSSSVNTTAGKQTFTAYRKTVDAEHARAIDDYLTMYGYKLNVVQKPNINARSAFTYVKTIGCQLQSTMCTEDVVKIENIFDKGVTFWQNGDRIADYSQTNTPKEV